ncbi:MAG: EAL domain-containing protein [Pseudomonadota bacterium]
MTSRLTAITVFTILLILAASTAGSTFVLQQYQKLTSEDGATAEVIRMRNGVFALLDLIRANEALTSVLEQGHLNGAAGDQLLEAADFLFVRLETLRSGMGDSPPRSALEAIAQTGAFVTALDAMIATPDEISEGKQQLSRKLKNATAALIRYYDEQKEQHIVAIERQRAVLLQLVQTTIGLMLTFMMITIGAIFLWRSEFLARTRRREAEQRANQLAYYDSLTGLPNRVQFQRVATRIMAKHDAPALFVIDLDEFKAVNDSHGHHIGDAMLRLVGARLSAIFGSRGGIAARLGGDEFAAMLPDPGSKQRLEGFLSDLIETVSAPESRDGVKIAPKLSIGAACPDSLDPADPPTLDALMRAADYALYEAKSAGRFTGRIYNHDMASQIAERRALKQAMPTALMQGDFFIEYQPKFDLASGRLRGFEALARWKHNGGIVPPDVFIKIAEEDDFIARLDSWVLREAVNQGIIWNEMATTPVGISVNLSEHNFRNPGTIADIRLALESSGFPPELVTFDVTEKVLIDNWLAAVQTLKQFSALGVRMALDDFGTGLSSLSYLSKLPIDELKIDRSLIVDVETSDRARLMLDALIDIAAGLDKQITAEGIETRGQAEILRDLGGDSGQGYYFSWPVTPKEARRIVLSGLRVMQDADVTLHNSAAVGEIRDRRAIRSG